MKKNYLLLLLLILPLASCQETPTILKYRLNEDHLSYTVYSYEIYNKRLVIPSEYYGLPVTNISDSCFFNCSSIISVTLPSSLISIGNFAFANCSSLKDLIFDTNISSIGNYAFMNTKVNEITLPDNLSSLGEYAFARCLNLNSCRLSNSLLSLQKSTFEECSSLSAISSPTLEILGDSVFSKCSSLTNFNFPSLKSIDDKCFYKCSSLTKFALPNTLESIGDFAFSDCGDALEQVFVPKSVVTMGANVFANCKNLTILCEIKKSEQPETWVDGWQGTWKDNEQKAKNPVVLWEQSGLID